MKYLLNFITAFFLFTSISNGQFNSTFQTFLEESMTFLEDEVNPIGLSISVRSGDKVWSDAIGISSVDDSLTTSSIFGMASVTKTFISAAILKMMEENMLTLSDPLHLYLPSYDNIDSTITIRELLNHTSGLYDFTNHPEFWETVFDDQFQFYSFSPEEIIQLGVLEKEFDRGTDQQYSNTNYILLGMIITEIANRPYYEEIFELFNMEQNYPSISCPPFNSNISELANVWSDSAQVYQNIMNLGIGFDGLYSAVGSSGAFVGTASDIAQWGYDLYAGNLLSESSMDSLFDYPPFIFGGDAEYGLGVINVPTTCGGNTVGHDGYLLYTSDLVYSEELDLSVVILTNDNGDAFAQIGGLAQIRDEILCAYENSITTSSKDITEKVEVEIYPNPVSDMVSIKLPQYFDQSVQIEVYNEIGSLVYAQKLRNDDQQTFQIDYFSKVANGFYFIKIFDKENSYTEKVVKL